nr:MAG TPA: hypothetical protein [Caudoviricetes sp.]
MVHNHYICNIKLILSPSAARTLPLLGILICPIL